MSLLLGLWWLGATTPALNVPVVLPAGEAAADWHHALSLCDAYRLTPIAAAPRSGPMVKIQSSASGLAITVRDESGQVRTDSVLRADHERPNDKAANIACSLLRPTSDSSGGIPLPDAEPVVVPKPIRIRQDGPRPKPAAAPAAAATPTPIAPTPLPTPMTRALAPGEQLDGLMPTGATGVCTCSWITDDSDLRSDDARWSFAPDCDTCEPTPPLEIREEVVDRRAGGRR
jgi:hypothetical protein